MPGLSQQKTKSSNPFGYDNARPLWLYSISIEDIEIRKQRRQAFGQVKTAAYHLGLSRHQMLRCIGKRAKCARCGKEYAVRDQKASEIVETVNSKVFNPLK